RRGSPHRNRPRRNGTRVDHGDGPALHHHLQGAGLQIRRARPRRLPPGLAQRSFESEVVGDGARDTSGLKRESFRERCGGRGLRVVAVRIPAASDLVGIYEDVGAVLITLGTSSVPSFRFSTSVSDGSAISAIRTSPGCFPFERKIFPPVSST